MTLVRHYGGGEFGIEGPYSEVVRRECRGQDTGSRAPSSETIGTPGIRWESLARAWVGYIDAVDAVVERCKKRGLRIDTSQMKPQESNNACLPVKAADLRRYQAEGVNWLLTHAAEGCILADDMGLGKTVQAIRAARALRFGGPTVVVCPGFARGVWPAEAKKWWKEAEVIRLEGTRPQKRPDLLEALVRPIVERPDKKHGRIIVVNYDILYAWVDYLTGETDLPKYMRPIAEAVGLPGPVVKPVLCVLDEGHFVSSEKSRRSKAAKKLAHACPNRFALTGTPVENNIQDFWNLVDTVSPGRMGPNFFSYGVRYCDGHKEQVSATEAYWKWSGQSNLDELARRCRYFVLRRTTDEVKLDLPPRIRHIMPVEVPKGGRVALQTALKDDRALRRALDLAADGKLRNVVDFVETKVREGHKCVVFFHRRQMAKLTADAARSFGATVGEWMGGVSQGKREKTREESPQVMCVTMDSTKGGIDLSAYDVAVFAELSWVPSTLAQCEKRLHRFGQLRTVNIFYFIAEGTIDELVRDGCIKKLEGVRDLGLLGNDNEKLLADLDGDMRASGAAALAKLAESLVA